MSDQDNPISQDALEEAKVREIIDKYYEPVVTAMKNLIAAQTDLIAKMITQGAFNMTAALEIAALNSHAICCAEKLKSVAKTQKPEEVTK